jgi:hypothetical protein
MLPALLMIAAGVVLLVRLHHPAFHVTGAAITSQQHIACGTRVSATISTNGSPGILSYRWLFQPGRSSQPSLRQSVSAGQGRVEVTVVVQGLGNGEATERVTVQILRPDPRSASAAVRVSC